MKSGLGLRARLSILVVAATLPLLLLPVWSALRGDEPRGELILPALALAASLLGAWWAGRRVASEFNRVAQSLQQHQLEFQTQLRRSQDAYAVLDRVLNSMDEGVIASSSMGDLLMFNAAAARTFPLAGPGIEPRHWAAHFGLYEKDGQSLLAADALPMVRAIRGEAGTMLVFARNGVVPEGRMLQCNFHPMQGEGGIHGGLVVFTDMTELQELQAEQAAQVGKLRRIQRRLVEAQRIGRIGNWELELPGRRLWWSDEVYGLFGLEHGDSGLTLDDFVQRVHPDDRARLDALRETAIAQGTGIDVEYRIVKPGGEPAWMYELGDVRRGPDGVPVAFAGVVQDITPRKQSELSLVESERELQSYTRMLQHAAEAAQAITGQQSLHGTLDELARQAAAVTGAGQAMARLAGGLDWPRVAIAANAQVAGSGKPLRLSREELAADPRWDGFGVVNGLLAVALGDGGPHTGLLLLLDKHAGDFTERDEYVAMELAQLASIAIENASLLTQVRELNAGLEARIAARTAELARQEARYRTLADQAPEVVWNVDPAGRVTYMNRAWFELVGGSGDDWLGHNWRQRVHPDDLAAMAANWERSRETLLPYTGTRRILGRDGRWHTTSYRAAPVIEEGKVAFWVGIDSDITELKAIEQALRGSNAELQAFSYSVSHDLRAPLGAIGGFSRALQHKVGPDADERILHYVARIQAGVVKMEQLIDAMLSLAKVARAPITPEPVDLSALARDVVEELQAADAGRNVTVRVQEGLVTLGDSRLLRIVLQNLLGNAWKFTSQRGQAVIEAGTRGGGVFFVRDNGAGFDMAYAGKLFGAFQRLHTESEFPGTGIGLATVRRIIARHQGRVWAESEPGKGTTFFFSLSEKAPPAWLAGEDAPP